MRIAMVGHKRVPSREGGIEVVVEELAARMVMHGHSVTCYNRTGHHVSGKEYDIEHLDEYRGIRLKRVPTIDRKGLAAVTSSFFGCLAAAFGPYDVVHIHAEGPAMFSWLPRLTGKRVVLTVHGLDWARDKWKGSFGSWYIHTGEKTGGDDRIIFTGFVDGALREELYSNAYLFVLPSDLEGMPLCLLEAMSYSNCVITSDIEECYNVIHDNGIVFRKGDVDDLAQKLIYALEHPNAVRMFKWLAAEYVCTRFPWDKIVVETLKLYQK